MRRVQLLWVVVLILQSAISQPPTLIAYLDHDHPALGSDLALTVGVFGPPATVELELPDGIDGPTTIAVTGITTVRLHVRSDAAIGACAIRVIDGGQVQLLALYVGVYPWPAAQRPSRLWLALMTR